MSLPDRIAAYPDCARLFELAKRDVQGAKAKLTSANAAKIFQLRMHKYRALLRKDSRRMFDEGDLRWDKSEYDDLKVATSAEWVIVTRFGEDILDIQPLSGEENAPDFGSEPDRYIPGDSPPDDGGRDRDGDLSHEPGLLPEPTQPVPKIRRR